jgi:hypothetical protein
MKKITLFLMLLASYTASYGMQNNDPSIATKLLDAIERGFVANNMTELVQLLQNKHNNPNHINKHGLSPLLHIAQLKNDYHFKGFQPLHTAMMKLLLYHGACRTTKSKHGSYADLWAKEELDLIQQELDNEKNK